MWNTLIRAELVKWKHRSVTALALIGGLGLSSIRAVLYLFGPEAYVTLGQNPWDAYYDLSLTYFSLLVFPLLILAVTSWVVQVENKAKSWGDLLTLPTPRWRILASKLVPVVGFLALALLAFLLSSFVLAVLIGWVHPETEFNFYSPDWARIGSDSGKVFSYTLGVVGLQFLFALVFRNQIFPLALGVILCVLGFVFYMAFPVLAAYFPYSFPLSYKDIGISPSFELDQDGGIAWKSVLVFAAASLVSYPVFITKDQ